MAFLQVVFLHFDRRYKNKGLEIFVWMHPILGEPCYIGVSLVMCLCFNIFILFIVISLRSCFSSRRIHHVQ